IRRNPGRRFRYSCGGILAAVFYFVNHISRIIEILNPSTLRCLSSAGTLRSWITWRCHAAIRELKLTLSNPARAIKDRSFEPLALNNSGDVHQFTSWLPERGQLANSRLPAPS